MDANGHGRGGGGRGGGGSGGARITILASVVVVSLGYLMMWILLPTSLYKHTWKPILKTQLNSTFFGTQGINILIFTTPVILVALLGSIYAHLEKKSHSFGVIRKAAKWKWLARWRRPVLVRGPLGVVSWIELSFIITFLALLVWSFSVYLYVGYGRITPEDGEKRWMARWEVTVFRLGPTGNICLAFLFYPITRASTILPLFGLTSEASVKYHIWLGHTLMTLFTAHGLGYLLYWAVSGDLSEALKWEKTGISNIAGEISLLFGLILWVATIPRIRRKIFEIFFYTHYLYILFMIFFFFHVGISYAFYILPGFFLFMIDRYVRFLQSRRQVRLLSARVLTCEVLELNFSKSPSLSYNPTSIIFINIPKISKLQWHPFSISSSSALENDRLSVIISVDGGWTRKLYDMVSSSSIDRLEASVDGHYGPVSNHLLRYNSLVMISGGSGITPYFSIIRELLYASTTPNSEVPKILLICSFKNSSDLAMLNLLLPLSSTTYDLSRLDLQIKAYVTREKTEIEEHLTQPRTIWFKPNASDTPIFPSLGNNGYLWLGAIISSSFISFLIIIGILTRYYIYPIDHNKDGSFSTWEKTILYLLILCVCIVITSSIVVIRNKKRNSIETRQIIRTEGVTPEELESLPYQSIVESSEVHYGERPDLKQMLFGQSESSVGVLVCGPPALRHEVAAICGSGLAENLHIESLSFTWYNSLVMISGGSGITPYFSIIRELLYASTTPNSEVPKILLICSFKNSSDLAMLNLLLPLSSTTYDLSRLDLQIKAYVTREKTEIEEHLTQPRTIWFKPNASDTPIFPSLGNNGYLWLGAMISSSFISFLIIIGILTRYYIYPIDHNKDGSFSTWEKTILYLLILCVCIVITSSIVVIRNKKRNSIETRQIIRTEGVTPEELESLPYQSIVESSEVHYGERPDLKQMLFGQSESSVGVLVCGPPALRHEVAAICGSGLAENLHIESLSFTWYNSLVMISGGSGITPYFSIIRELLYASTTPNSEVPKILLICSFKNSSDLAMLNLLLPLSSTTYDLSRLDLQIKAYVTREKTEIEEHLTQPRTIWFKPNASDTPIFPSLGNNGYLWLGAIISSSFISFLIIIGILTRYYIYPIDHNKDGSFSTWEKTILYLLILCVCIVITSSIVVIRNKKRNSIETRQIIRTEGVTPEELESLPYQSIVESSEVHYGERPDLKQMLFGQSESSVGVLVCGPPALRHEVAAICGSGLAENLHIESLSFTWYNSLVMISGGSGITPYFSIIRELLYASTTPNSEVPKILLICSFKNSSDLAMLNLLLPLSSTTYDLSRLDLQIKAYVTREKTEIEEHLTQPRTIWFKPNASDTPIFPSLGNNGYLWLGAIISSSFISFLIIIGILTRYYIYPIDHNKDGSFSTWEKTILYLLILCVCIVITSSIVVIRNKKRNSIETRQIIRTEGVTPEELESLPYQSIVESSEVHYGERPDLKQMLFGQSESSVGVLVCGPPALRHEVAAICGSGLAENLHFESLSFTW